MNGEILGRKGLCDLGYYGRQSILTWVRGCLFRVHEVSKIFKVLKSYHRRKEENHFIYLVRGNYSGRFKS